MRSLCARRSGLGLQEHVSEPSQAVLLSPTGQARGLPRGPAPRGWQIRAAHGGVCARVGAGVWPCGCFSGRPLLSLPQGSL